MRGTINPHGLTIWQAEHTSLGERSLAYLVIPTRSLMYRKAVHYKLAVSPMSTVPVPSF